MRFEIPDHKRLVHELQIPLRWSDMDAMQHVNNATYFSYLEIARVDWFRTIDIVPDLNGDGPVVANAFCNFAKQLEYPGTVRAKLYVANPGRASFDTYTTFERSDSPGVIHAVGGATVVWVNYREKKSKPLPDWFSSLLANPSN